MPFPDNPANASSGLAGFFLALMARPRLTGSITLIGRGGGRSGSMDGLVLVFFGDGV
jgi:hypothetical protein